MAMKLDPELGRELVAAISELCDDTINAIAVKAFQHTKMLGENTVTQQLEEKFMTFQKQYNDVVFPAFLQAQETLKEFTNYAELQAAFQANTDVDHSSSGASAAENLGAQRSNVQKLTDLIS